MESSNSEPQNSSKQKLVFRYEYFLDKHEFREWSSRLNSMTSESRMDYLIRQFETLQHVEFKNKTVCNIRVVLFANIFYEQLCAVIKNYNAMLGIATHQQLVAIQETLSKLTQYFQCLETLDDLKLPLIIDKTLMKKILEKFDEAFLYTNNMKLLLQIAQCFRSNTKIKANHFNFVSLDLSLPDSYYFAKLEALYKKYEQYFSGKETYIAPMKKNSSSKDERALLNMKKKSSREDKSIYELQVITLQQLLNLQSMQKISKHLEKEYMSSQDKILLLISLKCMALKNQFKANPSIKTNFLMLHYSFIRSGTDIVIADVLEESELALPEERQIYEDLLVKMIPKLGEDSQLLEIFMHAEPKCFLERPYQSKRTEVGQIQLFVAQQIDLIEQAFRQGTVPKGLLTQLLKKDKLMSFIGLVLGFVYSFDSIFSSTNDVAIYKMYVKMLDFIKRCYLSFASHTWHYPLELMVLICSETFEEFHMDIEQDIKDITKKMITGFNNGGLPIWVTYDNGVFKTDKVSKLEAFQAIKFYLKDCFKMENNFLEFDQQIPMDVESSMLMIELVKIRFHELEPNEQQKKFYNTALEECMRHNVNPRFRWFEGFDFKIDAIRRSDEFELQREVKSPQYRNLIREVINLREVDYCSKARNDHNINELIESLKFARGFKLDKTDFRMGSNEMLLFDTLEIMSSLLTHPIEIVDPPPENEIISQHLSMLLYIYNTRQTVCFDSMHYKLLLHNIFLKFIDTPYSLTKPYYEKYTIFFRDFLYVTDVIEISDHLLELLCGTIETREGLNLKLKILVGIIKKRNQVERSQNKKFFALELSEVTIKFMSILSQKLNADVYMNIGVLLWKVHKIMSPPEEKFSFEIVFDYNAMNKLDVFRHFKTKSIIEQNERDIFLAQMAESIVSNKQSDSLSQNNIIKLIDLLQNYGVNFKIPQLQQQYLKTDVEAIPAGKLLLVLYTLGLKTDKFDPVEQQVLNRIATSLSKRKPKFLINEPNLARPKFLMRDDEGFSKNLSLMVKAEGQKNIQIWLDFINLWGTEEDVYNFAIQIPATAHQIRKVVTLKTILRLGCLEAHLEGYLFTLQPLLGIEEIHRTCEELVAQIQKQQPSPSSQHSNIKQATYLFLMLQLAAKQSDSIQAFLFKNLQQIDFYKKLPISDAGLLSKLEKAIVHFIRLLIREYKKVMDGLKSNLLKLDASERAILKEKIDYAFKLLSCIPKSALNLCKQSEKKEDDQNWESEEEKQELSQDDSPSQQEKVESKEPKKKKSKGYHGDNDEQHEDNDGQEHDNESGLSGDSSGQMDDDEEVQKDEITETLLEMRTGYKAYLDYLTIREELDVLIRGDYEKLEKDFNEKKLSKDVQDYLRTIVKLLESLDTANKRILEKMNPYMLRIMKAMGLKGAAEVQPPKDDPVATKIKPLERDISDSDYNSDDDEGDDDESDQQSLTEDQQTNPQDNQNVTEVDEVPDHGNDEQQELQYVDGENQHGMEQQEKQHQGENENAQNENQQEAPQVNVQNFPVMSLEELFGQLFGGGIHRKKKKHRLDDEEIPLSIIIQEGSLFHRFEVIASGDRYLTEIEFEKAIELVLYKMFEGDGEHHLFNIHANLIQSKYCCSIYANSIFMLLRIKQKPQDSQLLKDYPMLTRDYEDTQSSLTMYDRFLNNACRCLGSFEAPEFYTQQDPPIQSVQDLEERLGLEKQPNMVTVALVLMINQSNDNFNDSDTDEIIRAFKLQQSDEDEEQKKLKQPVNRGMRVRSKHIESLCRNAYRHTFVLHQYQMLQEFIDRNINKVLKIFMIVSLEELGRSVYQMHKKVELIQKDIMADIDSKADMTNILNDLTRTYVKKFDVFYYTFKHLLRTFDDIEEDAQAKSAIYDKINKNEILNKVLVVSLCHLNFYKKYLEVPDKPLPKSLNELMLNELTLINTAFMVFSVFKKTIRLDPPEKVNGYLNEYLIKPNSCPYKTLEESVNLIMPLLGLDFLCIPKYQKILLPPIFEHPEQGYHLPVSFRLIELNDDEENSQMLEIRRNCSFDIAFYQLRRPRFRVQYFKQEGNDQGGLRRQFMLGWQGFGIGEQANFIGKILAIAFRDNMLYGGRFDISMALALTGYKLDLEFVKNDDPDFYKHVSWMKTNPVEGLELDFTRIRKYYDAEVHVDLKPDGKNIPVTDANKNEYIELMLQDKYFGGRRKEMQELRKGFFSIVPEKCVRILTPSELLDRISGVDTFNVEQLKKNVMYEGYSSTSQIVQWFWKEVNSFDFKERQTFLHFLTGTYKLPHGLKNYSFTLERVYDTNRLPVAHTCFNTLDLPEYTTYNVFREKFRTAVFEGNDNYGIM